MLTLNISKNILKFLQDMEGDTLEEKIVRLLSRESTNLLRECEDEIRGFELKYKMTFEKFAEAWEKGEIPAKWSHPVERDYMVWEELEAERKEYLSQLKEIEDLLDG